MSEDLLQEAIQRAGIGNAFRMVETPNFMEEIERVGAEASLANGTFHRFLEAIVTANTIPATWQKLADLGWDDEDVTGLLDGGLLMEAATTLVAAVNVGALSLREFNEFANYPNQEVTIFYLTPEARDLVKWLQGKVMMPKISGDAYHTEQ